MDARAIDDQRLKEVVKTAVVELIEERRDLVLGLLEEALEDVGLARAIEEGATTASVTYLT